MTDRGFGFVRAPSGQDYFFHLTDLQGDLEFDNLVEGIEVSFEVKREPSHGKAGAAQNVRSHAPRPEADSGERPGDA